MALPEADRTGRIIRLVKVKTMKNSRLWLLLPLVLGGLVLACVCAGVLFTTVLRLWPTPPVGVILIYEVDPEFTPDPSRVDMQALVAAIDARVNPGGWDRNGQVKHLDNGTVEIGIFGQDPAKVRQIERILDRTGTLEFRILANKLDHKDLLDRARAEKTSALRDSEGQIQAWWVPVQKGQEKDFESYMYDTDREGRRSPIPESQREVAIREVVRDGMPTVEILVVKDPFDVDGGYLVDVARDWDEVGKPCVAFQFDSSGAKLFGRLTSLNSPDEVRDFYRKLGIILDGRLYSAPRIKSPIYDRGVIEGSFTVEAVDNLVSVLNAGPLPAAIRQVEKRKVGTGP